jgi:hypothetical protein
MIEFLNDDKDTRRTFYPSTLRQQREFLAYASG